MKLGVKFTETSIGRKQVVAITGLVLISFVVAHLAGNLIIFLGPEAFNEYAHHLHNLRPALNIAELILLYIFVVHMWFTAKLVAENKQARELAYDQPITKSKRSLSARLMPLTGVILVSFIVYHLIDFTFVEKLTPRRIIDGENYGLFGIVYNSFKNPLHSIFYILAMCAVGFHLSHGIQSVVQTFGLVKSCKKIKTISIAVGVLVALAFSSIPISIMLGLIPLK